MNLVFENISFLIPIHPYLNSEKETELLPQRKELGQGQGRKS